MFRWMNYLLITIERLRQHWILVFWTLVGLTTATVLSMSLLLYVDAVNTDVLRDELDAEPYAFRLRYVGAWEGNISRPDVENTTAAIENKLINTVDLQLRQVMRYVSIGRWSVRDDVGNLGTFVVSGLEGYEEKVEVVAGEWYTQATLPDGTYPVMISETFMLTTGVQVGDTLSLQRSGWEPLTLDVVGMWRSIIPEDTSWVLPVAVLRSGLNAAI